MLTRFGLLLGFTLGLGACATEGDLKLPGVYRIDIQQGNIIEQEMLDKLKPGMDKNQVRFIMGTPVLVDTFHTDRWEYVFTYSEGGKRRSQRHVTLYFEDEKLARIGGDVVAGERKASEELTPQQAPPVDVPLRDSRSGFFSRLFNALPFVGDEDTVPNTAGDRTDEAAESKAAGSGGTGAAAATTPSSAETGSDQSANGGAEGETAAPEAEATDAAPEPEEAPPPDTADATPSE